MKHERCILYWVAQTDVETREGSKVSITSAIVCVRVGAWVVISAHSKARHIALAPHRRLSWAERGRGAAELGPGRPQP